MKFTTRNNRQPLLMTPATFWCIKNRFYGTYYNEATGDWTDDVSRVSLFAIHDADAHIRGLRETYMRTNVRPGDDIVITPFAGELRTLVRRLERHLP